MKTKKLETITCPYCGAEYLPSEIYVPNAFFGKPLSVIRDNNGKIEDVVGQPMDLSEKYVCDSCNREFSVMAKVSFLTKETEEFQEESETIIRHNIIFNEE